LATDTEEEGKKNARRWGELAINILLFFPVSLSLFFPVFPLFPRGQEFFL
jgi:hypothetical protein